MSLLMKALQKAEKGGGELALEPLAADPASAEAEPPPRSPAQQQAAAVFEAAAPARRRSLVIPFALLAFVVLGGGGAAYVYFATRPAPLLATPRPMPAAPITPAPVAARDAAPPASPVAPPAAPPPTDVRTPAPAAEAAPGGGREAAPSTSAAADAAPAHASASPPAREAGPAPPKRTTTKKTLTGPQPGPAEQARPAGPDQSTKIAAEAGEAISVSRMQRQLAVNPSVMAGYTAIESGRYADAETAYRQALGNEPQNVDAMLGLAAALVGQGRAEEASRHYVKVLQLDPRNSTAQAGLIAILGGLNPEGAEQRLKLLAAVDPTPFVHFTLGNLYARGNRWEDARGRYAEALRGEPANAEYAYNLAVSLDHLKQYRPALDHYRKALELAATKPGSAIDPARVSTRIAELERAPEQQ